MPNANRWKRNRREQQQQQQQRATHAYGVMQIVVDGNDRDWRAKNQPFTEYIVPAFYVSFRFQHFQFTVNQTDYIYMFLFFAAALQELVLIENEFE